MEVHRLTVIVVDFDGIGADAVKMEIENARYGNRCIAPEIQSIETRDIGEWSDEHPLNKKSTSAAEIQRLFS